MSDASDHAYGVIRTRILNGGFAPGARLTEEELALLCAVSRTPIRDALRRLAAEELVTIVPRHGTFVRRWSVSEIDEIFDLRVRLEGYGARMAAASITAKAIAGLRDAVARIDEVLTATAPPDLKRFLAANRVIHEEITNATGSARLAQLIARLTEQPVIARTASLYTLDELKRSNDHHRELVAAFENRDSDWAEAVMTSHIKAAHHAFRRSIEQR